MVINVRIAFSYVILLHYCVQYPVSAFLSRFAYIEYPVF